MRATTLTPDLKNVKYEDLTDLVDYVNSHEFTWKAQMNPRFEGKTLAELKDKALSVEGPKNLAQSSSVEKVQSQLSSTNTRSLAQTKSSVMTDSSSALRNRAELESSAFQSAQVIANQYWDLPADDFNPSDLPDTWDWRDVDGFDFTSPIRDQGGCGSCYTISFVQALESRVKIHTGKEY